MWKSHSLIYPCVEPVGVELESTPHIISQPLALLFDRVDHEELEIIVGVR